jgi:hypothetical protein
MSFCLPYALCASYALYAVCAILPYLLHPAVRFELGHPENEPLYLSYVSGVSGRGSIVHGNIHRMGSDITESIFVTPYQSFQ